ncbi:MAG: dTDP-4-dehydrorhamnose reductase [Flavobacteriaceae bacterium]
MARYLVTGAQGQLGQCFQAIDSEFPMHHLIFADRKQVDITKPKKIRNFFKDQPFEGIINCAAYTQVDQAEEDLQKLEQINVKGLQNLIAFAEQENLSLIHFSTDFVFDGTASIPYKEDQKTNPINAYGSSKYKGEQLFQKTKCSHAIFRVSWLFSPFGNNFVKTILNLGKTKEFIKVIDDQWGRPTYGIDLARGVLKAISQPNFFDYTCYHFAQLGSTSWFDFAKEIMRLSKSTCQLIPCSSNEYITKATRPSYSVLNTSRIENHVSITLSSWENALQRCLNRISKS